MNYSDLSDFDINMRVADAIEKQTGREIGPALPDYCNLSSNAWPIIAANKINIIWRGETCGARTVHTPVIEDANPLRAAMVVYLMMQEQQHDNGK
ncbi:MAG: phage protein NinX family protein [Serratia sp. (in: enterobacteria)]|uniref:phage protein NinX family protein n=1 Tax=Serratia sp. (in: enterobacteria) TaxID=616 RepID=UPI003F2ED90A